MGPNITLGDSNVPRVLLGVLQATLDTQIHRLVSGYAPPPPPPKANAEVLPLDNKRVAGMKADVAFLRGLADLQAKSEESKQVRRQKTLIVRKEFEAEKRTTTASTPQGVFSRPVKLSLMPAIQTLCDFFEQLPTLPCAVCDKILAKSLEQETPEQLLCGDWYHSGCVRAFMQQPPFGTSKRCPRCNDVFSHRLWTENNQRSAEKNWVEKQRTADEIALIDDFLGLKPTKK